MGLTERHWFENEDVPENYEWALEDAVYNSCANKKADTVEVVRCKNDKEAIIYDLNVAKLMLCNWQMLTPEMCVRIGQAITSALALLKEQEARELTIDEFREWKKNQKRDPLCILWENDTSPMWILNPNDVHEPALLMGKLKLFTGKPNFEQCKAVKWDK